MSQVYAQTATAEPAAGAYCSGLTANSGSFRRRAETDGSSGAEGTFTVDGSASNLRAIYFRCLVPAGSVWNAGTWTIRVNITTAAANTTITRAFVCRVDSSDVNQETLGSNTGLSVDISSTGVKSFTVSQGSSSSPAAGDNVVIVLGITNSNSCTRTLGVTPNQKIDSPFDTPPSDDSQAPRRIFLWGR